MIGQSQEYLLHLREKYVRSKHTGKRVLVVDDNTTLARSVARVMTLWGHDARSVFDGPSAYEEALLWKPDVVLLDIDLPRLSGYEVAQKIRRDVLSKNMVLVAITGYERPLRTHQAMERIFNFVFTKPASLEDLRGAIAA